MGCGYGLGREGGVGKRLCVGGGLKGVIEVGEGQGS